MRERECIVFCQACFFTVVVDKKGEGVYNGNGIVLSGETRGAKMKKNIIAALAVLGFVLIAFAGCTVINASIKIEFESNGGTPCAAILAEDIASVRMPTDPKKEGYIFDGWYLDDGVWEKPFTKSTMFEMPVSDLAHLTVYAKWSKSGQGGSNYDKQQITITFDGGAGNYERSRVVTVGEKMYTLPLLTRVGYKFDGWYTAGNDGKKITAGYVVDFTQDITLVAKWTANTYRVVFDGNGADGYMQPQTFTYDKSQSLSVNTFTKAGYKFGGWKYYNGAYDELLSDKQRVSNLTDKGEIELTAHWIGNRFTVVFDVNGATSSSSLQEDFRYGENCDLFDINYSIHKTGYKLTGWQCGERVIEGDYIPFDFIPDDGERLTFTAIWQPITYTVYFSQNGSGASGYMPSMTMTYDQEYTLPSCAYAKQGYKFTNWAYNGKILDEPTVRNLAEYETSIYIYALWSPITYTVVYDGNGADFGDIPNQTVTYNQSFNLAKNEFVKNGYVFAYYVSEVSEKLYFSGSYITENLAHEQDAIVTVKAVWRPIYEGEGTEKSPYIMQTAADVHGLNVLFREKVFLSSKKDLHILFGADIDMQGETLTPIDERCDGGFAYVIDGGGRTLRNYVMSSTVNGKCGLITSNYGTIRNLNISDAQLNVRQYVTDMGVLTGYNTGSIYNCSVVNSQVIYAAERGNSGSRVGGLVGNMHSGSVRNCYFTGSITANQPDGEYLHVGGIAGMITNGYILSSYANSEIDVTTKNYSRTGGIAGAFDYATSTTSESKILQSFAAGTINVNVKDETSCAGGIAGRGNSFADVYHSVTVQITAENGAVCETTCTENLIDDGNLRSKEWFAEKLPLFALQNWVIDNNAYPVFGSAEEISVMEIGTKEQLVLLSGSALKGNYKLTADIDLDGAEWKPSKNYGLFDGGGFKVSNFTVKTLSDNSIGFFTENFGTVRNLILSDFTLSAETFGSITAGGTVARNYGKIAYCKTAGIINVESKSSIIIAGGIAGNTNTGEISSCYAQVNITATSFASRVYAGGIAASVSAGKISGCYTTGIINGVTGGTVSSVAYLYGIAPYAEHSFSMCDFTTKDRSMQITLAAAGAANYGCTTQKMNSIMASSGMYVKEPYNFGNPEFLKKMGFGAFVSADDLAENPRHAWILESENLPVLYFEK